MSKFAAERKKEVEAALSRSKGIVIRTPELRRPTVAPKPSSVPPPAPPPKSIEIPAVAPPVCSEMEDRTPVVDEDDFVPLTRLVPSLDQPPLKRLRTARDMEAQEKRR